MVSSLLLAAFSSLPEFAASVVALLEAALLPAACALADAQPVAESRASAPEDSTLAVRLVDDLLAVLPGDSSRDGYWLAEELHEQAPRRADSSRDEDSVVSALDDCWAALQDGYWLEPALDAQALLPVCSFPDARSAASRLDDLAVPAPVPLRDDSREPRPADRGGLRSRAEAVVPVALHLPADDPSLVLLSSLVAQLLRRDALRLRDVIAAFRFLPMVVPDERRVPVAAWQTARAAEAEFSSQPQRGSLPPQAAQSHDPR